MGEARQSKLLPLASLDKNEWPPSPCVCYPLCYMNIHKAWQGILRGALLNNCKAQLSHFFRRSAFNMGWFIALKPSHQNIRPRMSSEKWIKSAYPARTIQHFCTHVTLYMVQFMFNIIYFICGIVFQNYMNVIFFRRPKAFLKFKKNLAYIAKTKVLDSTDFVFWQRRTPRDTVSMTWSASNELPLLQTTFTGWWPFIVSESSQAVHIICVTSWLTWTQLIRFACNAFTMLS